MSLSTFPAARLEYYTLLTFSAILMVAIATYGRMKSSGLDLLDAYFLMIALYFGAYSFLDGILNHASGKDAVVVSLTFLPLFAALMILGFFFQALPASFKRSIKFHELMNKWIIVDRRVGLALAAISIGFNVYLFNEYGLLTYVGEELQQLGIGLPNWVGPVRSLVRYMGLSAFIFFASLILKTNVKLRSIYGLLLLSLAINYAIEGRRAVIELTLLVLFMWSTARGRNVYSLKNLPHIMLALTALFLFSNVYQTYRTQLLSISARIDGGEADSLGNAVLNTEASLENYKARRAMWSFNYMVTDEQIKSPTRIYAGAMLVQSLLNSVPAALLSSKTVIDSDEMTSMLYGFPVDDFPTNDFTSLLTDFGLLALPLFPVLIVAILWIAYRSSLFTFAGGGTAHLLVSTLCLQYFLRVENSYGDFFILARDLLLLCIAVVLTTKLWHGIRAVKTKPALHG